MDTKTPYIIAAIVVAIYTGMYVISKAAFNRGMNSFVFVFYRHAASSLLLLPIALLLERKNVRSMSRGLLLKLFFLALIGKLDSSDHLLFGAATEDGGGEAKELVWHSQDRRCSTLSGRCPGHRFLHRGVTEPSQPSPRLWRPCCSPRLQSSSKPRNVDHRHLPHVSAQRDMVPWMVLQAVILKEYPNKMVITTAQCLFSTTQSFVVAAVAERDWSKWKLQLDVSLLAVAYTGFVVTGVSYYLQAWCVQMKGPVFLAVWNPLCFVLTIFCSSFLREIVHVGSIVGGILLVSGLYSVLWGKSMESRIVELNDDNTVGDVQDGKQHKNDRRQEVAPDMKEQDEEASMPAAPV